MTRTKRRLKEPWHRAAVRSRSCARRFGPMTISAGSPDEVRPAEVCPIEVRLAEVNPAQVRLAQVHPMEVRPAKVRPDEVRFDLGVLASLVVPIILGGVRGTRGDDRNQPLGWDFQEQLRESPYRRGCFALDQMHQAFIPPL